MLTRAAASCCCLALFRSPARGGRVVLRVKLDTAVIPTCAVRGTHVEPERAKGVEHDMIGLAESRNSLRPSSRKHFGTSIDQRLQDMDRFLGGVVLVPGVNPIHHVWQRRGRKRRAALDEQVSSFMPVLHESGFRGVPLAKYDMAADAERD